MVNVSRTIRRLLNGEEGVTLVEALLVMPIVLIAITTMVELGVAVFYWNQTVKAVQIGARHASVSSPMMTMATYDTFMADGLSTLNEGVALPNNRISTSCGQGSAPCDGVAMNRLLTGGDGICGRRSPRIGVCDVAPWIDADNILITYTRSGLGYVGRPYGQVSTITVETVDLTFDFMILDSILPVLGTIAMPPNSVSVTSEDLSSCDTRC
ncbi:MAG: TadE family protein [Pseudomonadota bacterium]|nr:TadE family protein [Pseudomonadota bacterium]